MIDRLGFGGSSANGLCDFPFQTALCLALVFLCFPLSALVTILCVARHCVAGWLGSFVCVYDSGSVHTPSVRHPCVRSGMSSRGTGGEFPHGTTTRRIRATSRTGTWADSTFAVTNKQSLSDQTWLVTPTNPVEHEGHCPDQYWHKRWCLLLLLCCGCYSFGCPQDIGPSLCCTTTVIIVAVHKILSTTATTTTAALSDRNIIIIGK